ncbi:hypothetical protein PAMA_012892 [Pampus argenteus]
MSTNESTLAENIGRAVLAAIQDFSAATAAATATATATGPPQADSVPLASVPQRPSTHSRFVRRTKACKHYTRDVVCLPFSSASTFRIPRGDSRANLAQDGLIGKISFTSDCPVYLEEDEALEEAIQRSLLDECDGPAVNILRSSEMLSKEEIAGLLQAHSERVITSGTRQIYISRTNVWTTALRTPNGCLPRLNILYLQNGLYRTIGRMMSTIIIQGVEPPAFLSPSVVDYIVSGDILQVHVTPDDIGDPDLRENLKKVLSLLRENPSLRVLLDIPGEDEGLAADFVAGILKTSYSVLGSNRRAREELMVVKFREFLQCVENKELRDTYGDRTLTKDEEAFLNTLSPGHILAFATGSSKVPVIGFHPTPKLIFIHDEDRHLPNAHTCANELHLFVNATTMADDDDEFNYCFLVALMNGSLFSTI